MNKQELTIEMINVIYNIETFKNYDQEVIDEYEEKYLQDTAEEMADFIDDDEQEESISMNYNSENLVYYYKNYIENE